MLKFLKSNTVITNNNRKIKISVKNSMLAYKNYCNYLRNHDK